MWGGGLLFARPENACLGRLTCSLMAAEGSPRPLESERHIFGSARSNGSVASPCLLVGGPAPSAEVTRRAGITAVMALGIRVRRLDHEPPW